MDNEQIIKRVDWLDDQRRKEKDTVATLEDRITVLEGKLAAAHEQIKGQDSEITQLRATLDRIDRFENALAQHRLETNRAIEEIEKQRMERDREVEEVRRVQMEGINNHLADMQKWLDPITDLQNKMKARVEEEMRLAQMIINLEQQLKDLEQDEEEWTRNLRLVEESSRRENKRLTDVQGDVLALRKRVDEERGRLELSLDSIRKVENRVNELAALESERRETYHAFFEKQNIIQVERDRKWKEWQSRFETIENQAMEVETHLQDLHTAHRDVKRAQQSVETATERMERRINEITEIQRLAEDRFRQEWVTFKADDQKRWTNYTLNQEEQTREVNRKQEKIREQLTELEESLQETQDIVHQVQEQVEKRLQSLHALVRDWTANHERIFGRSQS